MFTDVAAIEDIVILLDDETEGTMDAPLEPVKIFLFLPVFFVAEHCHRTIDRLLEDPFDAPL